ncbi:hypothetical protein [Lacinutrix sp. Hel_I_90]|uniref:hypothetical protein n=1 Tax=Lacinutrix sp. Hel_I_90 TaxID=1249999 RepID=UPI000AF4D281|nr:hypothetical protein [Lacinutrix sp. Hel_I_90]
MNKIVLQTKEDISHDRWQAQSKRFTKGDTRLIYESLPENRLTSSKARIEVVLNKPLLGGLTDFDATVTYVQTYTIDIENPILDPVTNEPTGQTQMVTQIVRKDILKYFHKDLFGNISALLLAVDHLVPVEYTGITRVRYQLGYAYRENAVKFFTFDALTADDYDIILE